jgi:hypothetical protein
MKIRYLLLNRGIGLVAPSVGSALFVVPML